MAFPLRNRLKKQKDFEEVFAKGKTVKGSFFFCKVLLRNDETFRYAVTVPAKVASRATVRNRLKRRITAASQRILSPLPKGFDMVIVVQLDYGEADQLLEEALRKAFQAAYLISR